MHNLPNPHPFYRTTQESTTTGEAVAAQVLAHAIHSMEDTAFSALAALMGTTTALPICDDAVDGVLVRCVCV